MLSTQQLKEMTYEQGFAAGRRAHLESKQSQLAYGHPYRVGYRKGVKEYFDEVARREYEARLAG